MSTQPISQGRDVPLEQVLLITFSEPITCPAGSGCVTLKNMRRGTPVFGELEAIGSQILFTPTQGPDAPGLEESTWHEVVVSGIEDTSGLPMAGVYTWTFETVHIPPVVTEAYPRSSCVPSTTLPWVAFSEEVVRSSPLDFDLMWEGTQPVSGTSGYFYAAPQSPPPGYPLAHGAVFTPDLGLQDGAYEASVVGPTDVYSNVLVPYGWTFEADSTPPHVEETVPVAGASDGYPDEPVRVPSGYWLDEPFPELPPSSLQIRDEDGELVAGTLTAVGRDGYGIDGFATSGIEFSPSQVAQFDAPAVYTATVDYVTDFCEHPVVVYTWTFQMACLFTNTVWAERPGVASCGAEQFELSTGAIQGAAEYEWQVEVDGGVPVMTVTQGISLMVDTPLPGQVATVRVRGRDAQGCITHWSDPAEVSWEVCCPGAGAKQRPGCPIPTTPIPDSQFPKVVVVKRRSTGYNKIG